MADPDKKDKSLRAKSDSLTKRYSYLPWVNRVLKGNKLSIPDVINPGSGKASSHALEYSSVDDEFVVYPRIVQQGDSLIDLRDDAFDYAKDNNTFMHVKDSTLADFYSKNGLIKHNKEYQKGGQMNELLNMYDKDYIERYGLGGWMKENAGNLLTTAAGVGSMFIPGGQAAGLGMIAGGIAGMATPGQPAMDEPTESPYDDYGLRTVDQPISTSNIRPMAMGGELTEYEGPSHNQGGIKLGGIGAEVEGGEARTGDIIHSDDIKITQEILREFGKGYGGDVSITENDIGKSIADVIKSKERKYKKYEGDKWNEMSRKAAHLPFEKMSTILADREKVDGEIANGYEQMAYGGGLMFNRQLKRDGTGPEGKGPRTGRGLGTCYESGGELPDWLYDARGEAMREEEGEDNELKKGGIINDYNVGESYDVDDKEMERLENEGYEFEIII